MHRGRPSRPPPRQPPRPSRISFRIPFKNYSISLFELSQIRNCLARWPDTVLTPSGFPPGPLGPPPGLRPGPPPGSFPNPLLDPLSDPLPDPLSDLLLQAELYQEFVGLRLASGNNFLEEHLFKLTVIVRVFYLDNFLTMHDWQSLWPTE